MNDQNRNYVSVYYRSDLSLKQHNNSPINHVSSTAIRDNKIMLIVFDK